MVDDDNALNNSLDADPSFVSYMDMVLDLLQPLSLYSLSPLTNVSEQKAEVRSPYSFSDNTICLDFNYRVCFSVHAREREDSNACGAFNRTNIDIR